MPSCCDDYTGECDGGPDCPARKPSKVWCTASRQPCAQPYTCANACQLNTANSDGSSPHSTAGWELPPLGWAVLAALIAGLAFSVFYFFLKP